MSPTLQAAEHWVLNALEWIRLVVETLGALIIVAGVAVVLYRIATTLAGRRGSGFDQLRLTLGRYLSLGLEFLLAGDIITTAVAPTWEQIGKLAAIAAIRTGLNYFLMLEMEKDRSELHNKDGDDRSSQTGRT